MFLLLVSSALISAVSVKPLNLGTAIAIKIPKIAITTINSINVNPFLLYNLLLKKFNVNFHLILINY